MKNPIKAYKNYFDDLLVQRVMVPWLINDIDDRTADFRAFAIGFVEGIVPGIVIGGAVYAVRKLWYTYH